LRSIAGAILSLVLLVGIAVFSPALSVDKILVRGTTTENQKKISKVLESQIGKPLPQIDSAEIAKLLQPFKEIESFTLVSAPPHTLVVRIVERTPIAIVYVGGNFYYFDPAGVNLGRAKDTSKLPVLDIKGNPGKSENFKIAVSVLLALPAELLPKIALISATSIDNVSFRIRGYAAQKVIWGDDSNAILKSRVLAALMKNQSVNDRVTYDVSSPTAPTVRYH
jgi:cell division protein FtsQ